MTSTTADAAIDNSTANIVNYGVWAAQILGAVGLLVAGATKLAWPLSILSSAIPWTSEQSEVFVRSLGVVELAGGVGLVLPSLTRIAPGLTPLSALYCLVLQVCAVAFHLTRGEAGWLPVNLACLALAGIVVWGRGSRAPIDPRWP